MRTIFPITNEHQLMLDNGSIQAEFARLAGVRSIDQIGELPYELQYLEDTLETPVPGLLFSLPNLRGESTPQYRPEDPTRKDGGDGGKYLQEPDSGTVITVHEASRGKVGRATHLVLVEGTKQTLAVEQLTAKDGAKLVAGMQGCWGWMDGGDLHPDLVEIVKSGITRVTIFLDADVGSNPNVWAAANKLRNLLTASTPLPNSAIRFATVEGAVGNEGVDDVLGRTAVSKRRPFFSDCLRKAKTALPPRPVTEEERAEIEMSYEHGSMGYGKTMLPPGAKEVAERVYDEPITQLGMARRVADYYSDTLRWTGHEVRLFNGKFWREATQKDLISIVRTVIERGLGGLEGAVRLRDVEDKDVEAEVNRQQKSIDSMSSDAAIKGIINLVLADPTLELDRKAWDSNPHLHCVGAGIVDMRTSEIISTHVEAIGQYHTHFSAGSGLPTAPTPDFESVMAMIRMQNPEYVDFLQLLFGLSATGETSAMLAHLYGESRSGKSSISEAVTAALGASDSGGTEDNVGYSTFGSVGAIQESQSGGTTEELAMFVGQRMVFIDEASDKTKKLDQNLIKILATGGVFPVRRMYERIGKTRSKASVFLVGQAELPFSVDDEGMPTRFYPIKFTKKVPHDQLDADIQHRLRSDQANLDAFLWWVLQGAKRYYDAGGGEQAIIDATPECVKIDRQRYLTEANPLLEWLEDLGPDAIIPEEFRPTGPEGLQGCSTTAEAWKAYRGYVNYRRPSIQVRKRNRFPAYLKQLGLAEDSDRTTSRDRRLGNFIRGLRRINTNRSCIMDMELANLSPAEQEARREEFAANGGRAIPARENGGGAPDF